MKTDRRGFFGKIAGVGAAIFGVKAMPAAAKPAAFDMAPYKAHLRVMDHMLVRQKPKLWMVTFDSDGNLETLKAIRENQPEVRRILLHEANSPRNP